MKKNIRQAWLLLIAAILANISLFTSATTPKTGWQYNNPNGHSCFEQIEPQPIAFNQESMILQSSNPRPIAPDELEIIQSIKKPDNITEEIIDPTQDQIIRCPQGSILHLEANTLVTPLGELVTEPVTIRVKECYKLKDIIANKLQTVSNGKIIETAGMVEITALVAKDTLQLADGANIDIAIPGGAGERFELFNAEMDSSGDLNWILDEINPIRTKTISASQLPDPKKGKNAIPIESEIQKLFENDTSCKFGITHYILEESVGSYNMQAFNFKDVAGNTLGDFLNSQFDADKKIIANACESNQRFSISMRIDHQGKLLNPVIDERIQSSSRKKLFSALKHAPKLNRNLFDPISNGRERLKVLFGDMNRKNESPKKLRTLDEKNKPWEFPRYNIVLAENYGSCEYIEKKLSYMVASSMKLGWINWDRYYSQPASAITALNLKVENQNVDEVMIIFEDTQTLLLASRDTLGNFSSPYIPVNKKLRILCLINDEKNPQIFSYHILSGKNKLFNLKENQPKDQRDTGEEINTPA
ncbi:MAG: hypothetical protein ACKVOK_03040 [Flavobacteriales bacterium]